MTNQAGMWLAATLTIVGIAVAPYIQPPWILTLLVILLSGVLYLIKMTKYPAIAIIIISLLYGAGLISIFVFVTTIAIVVLGEIAYHCIDRGVFSYVGYIIAAMAGAFIVMGYLGYDAPLLVIIGVLVAVMLKAALDDRYDSLMIESLGVAMAMYFFEELGFQVDVSMLILAVIIALTVGFFSYRLKAADLSGLFSASLVGIILIVFADVRWFLIMLAFFIIGSACTRYRYDRKKKMGVAESHDGVRGYYNVFANGLVGVAAAVLFGITGNVMFLALFLGSVASAAADTVASEIGVVGATPILITTLERVPPGTNGGVTVAGEITATAAAFIIAVIAYLLNVADLQMVLIVTLAGFVGTNVDSLVGATLENSGRVGNAGTNLIATLCGGIFAMLFYLS
jgi:uncharacterized protein (TIGR00297 family)